MSIRGGRLILGQAERGHVEAAIDHFLTSLAEDQGPAAICVILSGSSGSDGPRGVRAIRAGGGMCMVQDPGSARFPEMPQAVIDTGLADYILSPARMPASLLAFVRHPHIRHGDGEEARRGADVEDLESILKLLRTRTNNDYIDYKRATMYRRVQRRMGLQRIARMDEYVRLLQRDADELTRLDKDMLIGVSSFFRDAGVFDSLMGKVVVPLIQAKPDDAPFRAWVVGCSTGEEAYSIATLLLEARSIAGKCCPIQVFATDVDERALETARAGVYPLSIANDIPSHRLEAFFTKQGQTYSVDKQLREAVVFSRHNLLADPPFSKLDLVSCRNVLIYIEPAAQKKVLSAFSFALNVGGCLLLGKSEGIARMEDLFEPISTQDRIYRLIRSNRGAAGGFPLYAGGRPSRAVDREHTVKDAALLPQANLEAVLRHFDASVVLIDSDGKILYFHGQTEKYLGHPEGPASLNILDMIGGALSAKLRRAIDRARQRDEPVRLAHVPLPQEPSLLADLTVMGLADCSSSGRLLAVIFEDARQPHAPESAQAVPPEDEPLVAQLEAEVTMLRTELRINSEGYDAAMEELHSANEEVMSMNEELQSANEELEASKEELQSVNEELSTVNSQLNDKVGELVEVNNDLVNLLGATEIATIFLDARLRIRRFTPQATALLNVIGSDLGRPIGHITQNFTGVDLTDDAGKVLESLLPLEKEVQARDGRWYTMRILPYRTLDDRIDGTVITFSDVTRLKQTEKELHYEKRYAERVAETMRHPLLVLDDQLQVLLANKAFYETFRVAPDRTLGRKVYELGNRQWDTPQLRMLLEEIIPQESAFEDFRVEHTFEQIGRKVVLLSGRRIQPLDDMPERILITLEDSTQRENDRMELSGLNTDLEQRVTDRTALAERRSDQLRQLAAELTRSEQRERERLARLLHDNLQQLLVAAKFQLTAIRSRAKDDRLREGIDLVEDLLDQSLSASRSLTVELSPTILHEAGLDAALLWLARQMGVRHNLKVEMQMNATVEQDGEGVAVLLFSAVRELLLNIVKHAGVDSARVQLDRIGDDGVRIIVSDEGKGFDPATLRAGEDAATGLGLFGLIQRLEHIGGKCVIDSAPGRGTNVTLTARVRS
jgi:two-component system CheB/CheR fusion protein